MRSPRPRSGSAHGNDKDDHVRHRPFCSPLQIKSTPPREVFLTPRATPKPIKRRVSSRLKHPVIKVKSEPPEVDPSKMRPPSPSDDPLLLSGSSSPPLRSRFTPAFSSSPSGSSCLDPPVSFAARLSGARIGPSESSPGADAHMLPIFNMPRVKDAKDAWSDSDDDEFNLTGEYTGKYKVFKVPTKADPPTSCTKEPMESWGRPVSPFPYSEIMERSLPLSDLPEECGGRDEIHGPAESHEDADMWEVATEPPLSDVEHTPPPSEDEFAELDDDLPPFDVNAESTQVLPLATPRRDISDSDRIISEEQEEEAQIDRELSVPVDDCSNVRLTLAKDGVSGIPVENDSSDEEDVEEDIIKITSGDPKAAARAAAILRMHDYDCILAAEKKKRSNRSAKSTQKRRKTIENAAISKSYVDSKSQRWQTLQGVTTSPGSRSLPLLELWRDAEDSVFLEHNSMSYGNASFTLSPLKTAKIYPEILFPPLTGEWNRDCWKRLDKCLTAERLAIGAERSLAGDVLADTGKISKAAVLDRFINQLGGASVLVGLGPDWSRDNLALRLDVLLRKQSRSVTRPPRQDLLGTTEPCYHKLLQEAVALSVPLERCPTSTSNCSDTTVVPDSRGMIKMLPDLSSCGEPAWQVNCPGGAIRTPSRTPDPPPPHPKDQVHLRHASPQKSMIPVPIKPKLLVDLRHHSPTKADGRIWRSAPRRSSGCSVKDLVRQYEGLDG